MTLSGWDPAALRLVALLPESARGPRREGIYALWLTVRLAQDLLLDPPLGERQQRRRIAALESRLSSLTLPPPLRRALNGALHQLREAAPAHAQQILAQLVAPARESVGVEASEAVAAAARAARERLSPAR